MHYYRKKANSPMKSAIYYTKNLDPWHNLAMEEYLLQKVEKQQILFFLWQNENTVVIGKNQNPWKECSFTLLEKEGGKLARRISGGGAVFHDTGNLNFSFLVDKDMYNLSKQLEVILGAVRSLGIEAQFQGRNDLIAQGKKFSGNAFCFRTQSALHHGTILLSADMSKLTRYLQVSPEKIRSKGIDSVRSRVVNLTEFKKDLTVDLMTQSLMASFEKIYGSNATLYQENSIAREDIEPFYQKQSSWEWRYGEAPHFDIELSNTFSWGSIDVCLKVNNARISQSIVYSDAMDEAFIQAIGEILKGCKLHAQDITKCIQDFPWEKEKREMAQEIALWLEKKEF